MNFSLGNHTSCCLKYSKYNSPGKPRRNFFIKSISESLFLCKNQREIFFAISRSNLCEIRGGNYQWIVSKNFMSWRNKLIFDHFERCWLHWPQFSIWIAETLQNKVIDGYFLHVGSHWPHSLIFRLPGFSELVATFTNVKSWLAICQVSWIFEKKARHDLQAAWCPGNFASFFYQRLNQACDILFEFSCISSVVPSDFFSFKPLWAFS